MRKDALERAGQIFEWQRFAVDHLAENRVEFVFIYHYFFGFWESSIHREYASTSGKIHSSTDFWRFVGEFVSVSDNRFSELLIPYCGGVL
jgi:hypothetical protein